MSVIGDIAVATWEVFVIASPFVILGLAAAGALHVLVPAGRIARWLGEPGFGATFRAALLGIPLPLCSCAVVPVTIELSRKGASREASLAFLVSTPETGVDSILLTWGLMGPVMAVARPLAALGTSLVAAASSIFAHRNTRSARPPEPAATPPEGPPAEAPGGRLRRALRYGFVDMLDEICFWLIVGLLLTGVITALVPERWIQEGLGAGPRSLVALLILGIPLYMCASASTPIAAALLFKGVSPGAALVFLLAGPATNASSLVVITRFFGRKFVGVYLASVVASALGAGFLLDAAAQRWAWSLTPSLSLADHQEGGLLYIGSAALLLALLLGSLARGSGRMAVRELVSDLRQWRRLLRRPGG